MCYTLDMSKLTIWLLLCIFALSLTALGQTPSGHDWLAKVNGMSCPMCAKNIEKQVKKIMGVTGVEIDLGTGQVKVTYAAGFRADKKVLTKAIEDAGFSVVEIKRGSE